MKKSNKVTFLTQAAVIAAIYVVLTIIFAPCYTLSRCKALKNKVLSGLPAVTAVKCAECS